MKILKNNSIKISELEKMAEKMFGNLVKAVVDVEKKIIALDAELHTDQEVKLLKQGSLQKNLWEINLYPEFFGTKNFVEFDSMINLRPSQNNRSRGVENLEIRNKIVKIVKNKIIK